MPINRKLLRELQAQPKPTTVIELILQGRTAIQIFGYTHFCKQDLKDYNLDIQEAAEDYGWTLQENTLTWTAELEGSTTGSAVTFGGTKPKKKDSAAITKSR